MSLYSLWKRWLNFSLICRSFIISLFIFRIWQVRIFHFLLHKHCIILLDMLKITHSLRINMTAPTNYSQFFSFKNWIFPIFSPFVGRGKWWVFKKENPTFLWGFVSTVLMHYLKPLTCLTSVSVVFI